MGLPDLSDKKNVRPMTSWVEPPARRDFPPPHRNGTAALARRPSQGASAQPVINHWIWPICFEQMGPLRPIRGDSGEAAFSRRRAGTTKLATTISLEDAARGKRRSPGPSMYRSIGLDGTMQFGGFKNSPSGAFPKRRHRRERLRAWRAVAAAGIGKGPAGDSISPFVCSRIDCSRPSATISIEVPITPFRGRAWRRHRSAQPGRVAFDVET